MKTKFISLTTNDDKPIIVNTANIATVQNYSSSPLTIVTLNFSTGESLSPKAILVNETYEEIQALLFE